MPRTWKSALAPYLAGIPRRTGFVGEARFGLINDLRFGERALPRMVDRCATLALPKGDSAATGLAAAGAPGAGARAGGLAPAPGARARRPTGRRLRAGRGRTVEALARYYADLARRLVAEGTRVWVIGGPGEKELAAEIARADPDIRDLTGPDLRNAILALAAANAAVSNDFGPAARRRRARHAGGRNFRADEPVALGPAQSDRRRDRDRERAALPTLPQAGLPPRPSSLHARHRRRSGRGATREAAGRASNLSPVISMARLSSDY